MMLYELDETEVALFFKTKTKVHEKPQLATADEPEWTLPNYDFIRAREVAAD